MTSRKSIAVLFAALFAACFCVLACTQDDDGAIPLSSGDDSYSGVGFFRKADLDSGARIHLASDTLFLQMGNLWTFSNCALKRIEIDKEKDGESLVLLPKIIIETSGEDCPAPYYHPDTVLALTFSEDELKNMLTQLADALSYGIILRAKGIVPSMDGNWIHFDYTPGEIDIRRGGAEVTGRLCVIGAELKEEAVAALFGA